MYSAADGKVPVFIFPTVNDDCDKWICALPDTTGFVTKCTGVS